MDAKELRLGNFVWNSTQNIAVPVNIKILNEQIYNKTKWESVYLTEEWIYKFGFIYEGDGVYRKGKVKLTISTTGVFKYHVTPVTNIIYLPHVHLLQNLYFALTENELEIEE